MSDFADLTYYEMLGVAQDATIEEISAAYRDAARREHPDRSSHADAHDRMILLNQARNTLLNSVQRMIYDELHLGLSHSSSAPSDGPPSVPGAFAGTFEEWLLAWAQYQQQEREVNELRRAEEMRQRAAQQRRQEQEARQRREREEQQQQRERERRRKEQEERERKEREQRQQEERERRRRERSAQERIRQEQRQRSRRGGEAPAESTQEMPSSDQPRIGVERTRRYFTQLAAKTVELKTNTVCAIKHGVVELRTSLQARQLAAMLGKILLFGTIALLITSPIWSPICYFLIENDSLHLGFLTNIIRTYGMIWVYIWVIAIGLSVIGWLLLRR